ncbi:hypothetical protein OXYTRIMIC_525 [Oxytricha trifallax]|uniref:Uncharacterized protein n=1 Tax=Oxytricha trifallax TaxID=1172189 RepID=A0A073I0V7_9SPIT|nr:hypothetical protein OXYTRIMIC_525 [Oxytricha trifallax]
MRTAENLRSKATKVLPKIEEIVKDVSDKVQIILKTLEQKNQRTKKQEVKEETMIFIQEKCYQIEQMDNQLQQYTNLINPIVETKISKSKYESQLNIEISQLEMFKFDSHKYEKVYKYIDDYTLAIKRMDEEIIDIVQVVNENNSFHLQKVYQMEIPQYFVIHGDRVVTDQKCFDLKTNQIIFNFETGSIDAFSLTDEFLIIAYTLYAKIVVYKWQNDTYEPYSKGSILNYGGQMKNEFFFRFRKNPYLEDDMIFYAQYRKSIYMITLNIEKISQSKAQKLNSQHEIADYNFINAFLMACISDTEITLIDYIQAKTVGVIKFQPNLCCIVPNQFNMSNMPIYIANSQSAYNELIVQDILSQGFKGKARLDGNKVPLSKIRVVNFENSEFTHVLILDEDRRLKLIEFIIE